MGKGMPERTKSERTNERTKRRIGYGDRDRLRLAPFGESSHTSKTLKILYLMPGGL